MFSNGISGFKGKKHTRKTLEKMSLTRKGRSNSGSFKKGQSSWNKGIKGQASHSFSRKFTEERREKISEAKKRYKFSEEHLKNMSLCRIGEKNKNWKGGITKFYEKVRTNSTYRKWRRLILRRDGNICINCGKYGKEVDHYPVSFKHLLDKYSIKTLEEAIICKELWKLKLGRTLCHKCHVLTENYGGKNLTVNL